MGKSCAGNQVVKYKVGIGLLNLRQSYQEEQNQLNVYITCMLYIIKDGLLECLTIDKG